MLARTMAKKIEKKGYIISRYDPPTLFLKECSQLCELLREDINKPIDLYFKTNLSVVNALWMILTGERLSLTDERLLKILKSVENVLKSAQVASLVALLFPNLFKRFSSRFERARKMFEDCKTLMRSAIKAHMVCM